MKSPNVLIVELRSQYTLPIARTLRELGVRSVILDPKRAADWLKAHSPQAVILSGGESSVHDADAPQPPEEIFAIESRRGDVPILGICYGMQWLAQKLGGDVDKGREYGPARIVHSEESPLFFQTPADQPVWMSHGESVVRVPEGFEVLARSDSGLIAAMARGSVYGVQFHPEVRHTEFGRKILQNFLIVAGVQRDWEPASMITRIQKRVVSEIGRKEKVIFGFSGGVDSTTIAAILAPILGDRLLAVTIDGGNLRENELAEIERHAGAANVQWKVIDAREEFIGALTKTTDESGATVDPTDAELKRKRFKKAYTKTLVAAAEAFGAVAVVQGTLAPDRIESGATGAAVIKSHHNVGLDMGKLKQIHPIDELFKYEIRELAVEVGLPEGVSARQPFPGPGLFVRVVGAPATGEKLDLVRWADARVREILEKHGVYKSLSQLVVAYINAKTVGVKGDARVYGGAIVVRGVTTSDFMTAQGVHLSHEVEDEISSTLTKHAGIVRVWYDPTDKPPATTEME